MGCGLFLFADTCCKRLPSMSSHAHETPPRPTKVMKFGGSSVGTAERLRLVARLVADASRDARVFVVLSALQGVTDQLHLAARRAVEDWDEAEELWDGLRRRHAEVAMELLLPVDLRVKVIQEIEALGQELHDRLRGIHLLAECSRQTMDAVLSLGERWCCQMAAEYFTSAGLPSAYVDSRPVVRTDDQFGQATADVDTTARLLRARLATEERVPVITGFLGSTGDGRTTTLGRGGSDFTASLLGAALHTDCIEIWTDVDGVMSADPRLVPDAVSLPRLSYQEAMELSYFGAKVIHPATMAPAVQAAIPIVIRNTFRPSFPGTVIGPEADPNGTIVKGVATIRQLALVDIEGSGLPGRRGIAGRIFSALAHAGVNVIMISQASSEHSICLVTRADDVPAAREALEHELHVEMAAKLVDPIQVTSPVASLSVVGEGMRSTPGIAGRLFGALGDHQVNVLAIAQGASQRNISLTVAEEMVPIAIRAVHQAFRPAAAGAAGRA
jgi:bifunctional aspartokinase / homoserine dehydrogenase 1